MPILTPAAENKRSKVESDAQSNADSTSRPYVRRISTVQADSTAEYQSDYNSPTGSVRVPSTADYPSKPTSPATHPSTILNSPRTTEPYSPPSVASHSTLQRETSYDFYPGASKRDHMGSNADSSMTLTSPAYVQPHPMTSTSPSSNIALPHLQSTSVDLPSRRSYREPTRLPPLTHEETTLSSESSTAPSKPSLFGGPSQQFPLMDPERSLRILPQPVPSQGLTKSLLDHSLTKISSPSPHPGFQPSSLDALVRAGELARVADDQEAELQQQRPP